MKYLSLSHSLFRISILPLALFLLSAGAVEAQLIDRVYNSENFTIDPQKEKQLFLEFDNLNFFRDNEYATKMMRGYTLPGFWLQGKAVYYALPTLKIEAGLHTLYYWGAERYPESTYEGIPRWTGREASKEVHLKPLLRAQLSLGKHTDIVFGSIYGGTNHRLITPLYDPERMMTADPETGLQLLHTTKRFDADVWVNWQSFIFHSDTHQEVFTVGLSSRWKLNDPEAPLHMYIPVQLLAQHHGGEIDTITVNSVQTLLNGALGVGVIWNVRQRALRKVSASINGAGYYQESGNYWPVNRGYGLYADLSVDVSDFRFRTAYWKAHDFFPIIGSPLYGVSTYEAPDLLMDNPQTLVLGIEYARSLGRGCSFGAEAECLNHFSGDKYVLGGARLRHSSEVSFSFGAYLRISFSTLLKTF